MKKIFKFKLCYDKGMGLKMKEEKHLNKEINIEDETLNQLNNLANELTKKNIPSEFLEEMMKKYLENNSYQNLPRNNSVKVLKKWEVISIVLDFYKSLDDELYKRVFNIVMNVNPKIRFNIYDIEDARGFRQRDFEDKNFRRYELNPYNVIHENKDMIYIPLKSEPEGHVELKKDTATLADAHIMVHELAHTFDVYLNYILDDKRKNIEKNNVLTESTAIAFEKLFTRYLFEKDIIDDYEYVRNILIKRTNHTYIQCEKSYGRLKMINIMQRNKEITNEDIKEILSPLNLTPIQENKYIELLIKEGAKMFDISIGYAMAGMISPTIEKNIMDGNKKNVKEYLEFSKIMDFEKALNALGISMDENGIEQLQSNKEEVGNDFKKEEKEER